MSFGAIGRLLRVSDVTVLTWVRDAAHRLPEPSAAAGTVIVTFDEMWHFLKKRLENCGFGGRMTRLPAAPSPGCWGGRDDRTLRRLIDKVGVEGKTFVTDDWEGFHRVIPEDRHFTGKDLTFSIEQDNSNIRHFLAPLPTPHQGCLQNRRDGGSFPADLPPPPRQPPQPRGPHLRFLVYLCIALSFFRPGLCKRSGPARFSSKPQQEDRSAGDAG